MARQKLQEARVKFGYSQSQLAKGLECSRSTIAQIERGTINGGDPFSLYYAIMIRECIDARDNALAVALVKEREEARASKTRSRVDITDNENKINRIKNLVEKVGGKHEE